MKHRNIAALLLALSLMAGCAQKPANTPEPVVAPEQTQEQPQEQEPAAPQEASGENTSQTADASQMTTVEDVVREGMTPVTADELRDGVYPVAVDCSSSMFKIADCSLTVAGGTMTAEIVIASKSYGYLYSGSADAAAAADKSAYINAEENGDGCVFTFPVEALDQGVACAAWSRNKELWYDRTLVFRADSLPLEAFKTVTNALSLALADGVYSVDVTLSGGSGKASVASPAALHVEGGAATATIVWSSANYDYMLVGGEKYLAEIVDGHSVFTIPVAAFDHPLSVIADTTAMSQPHEIDYTLTFDAASITAVKP